MSSRSVIPLAAGATMMVLILGSFGCAKGGDKLSDSTTTAVPMGNSHPGYCQVTGEKVDVAKATETPDLHSDYQGKRYVFCCNDCKPQFEKNPAKYIANPLEPKKQGSHTNHRHNH